MTKEQLIDLDIARQLVVKNRQHARSCKSLGDKKAARVHETLAAYHQQKVEELEQLLAA